MHGTLSKRGGVCIYAAYVYHVCWPRDSIFAGAHDRKKRKQNTFWQSTKATHSSETLLCTTLATSCSVCIRVPKTTDYAGVN